MAGLADLFDLNRNLHIKNPSEPKSPVTPIDDLEDRAPGKYSPEVADARKKLASLYRLTDLMGWSEGIYNHMTCRVPGTEKNHFLISPFGFLFNEVTASSLIVVDAEDGKIVDHGSTNFGYISRAYSLHSAVFQGRSDVNCVIHLHVPEVMAVSALKHGFVPFSQESIFIGPVSLHGFQGILLDLNEKECILKSLGQNNVMLLKDHGFVTCGSSIEEAFLRAYFFVYHIKAQVFLANVPKSEIDLPTEEAAKKTYEGLRYGEYSGTDANGQLLHWKSGELDWQAWMRWLDSMGMKTGYISKLTPWRT